MKKIFTLMAAVMLVASAFAQYKPGNQGGYESSRDRDNAYNNRGNKRDNDRRNNGYYFSARERDMQIARINREYDQKIHAVQNRVFMSPFKKQRIIRSLQDERRDEIRMVYAKFNDQRGRH
jgi:hypothetical protein